MAMKLLAALVMLVYAGLGTAYAAEAQLERDVVVEAYLDLAFGTEFETPTTRPDIILKRPQDQVAVVVPFPQRSSFRYVLFWQVGRVVADIAARSSGLQLRALGPDEAIEFINSPDTSSLGPNNAIVVNIGSREEIRESVEFAASPDPAIMEIYERALHQAETANGPVCLVATGEPDPTTGILGRALIWIEDGPWLDECLYEEIMQAFGLTNDFQSDLDSLFSDHSRATRPTLMDWCFWSIHTNAALKPGMDRVSARAVATNLFPNCAT